jgi:hypothetical protein
MVLLDRTAKVTIGAAISCFVTVSSAAAFAGIAWHDSEMASVEQRAANREEHRDLRNEIKGLANAVKASDVDRLHRATIVQWRALFAAQNPEIPIPEIP